uniref:Uncharacterized protein n=1 Tax=Globisporangium ultimum (strain ATCC 200006 / CBS 805.95 / DAOM BR144) TaxID=431595 RepID=K3W581_GLOUD
MLRSHCGNIRDESGLAVLCAAIGQVTRKLTLTPRNYEDVPLLSELAGFVSQLSASTKSLMTKFATMCRKWAGNVRKQYYSIRNIFSYALQAYGLGALDAAAVYELGELIVLFRNAMLFSTGSTFWPRLQKLEIAIAEIMVRRAPVLAALLTQREHAMTSLLRLVNTSVSPTLKRKCAPLDKLKGGFATYFDAFDDSSGIHYAINLFTGMVLTDGNSPGGLPATIRDHTRYKQLFGDHDFEVTFGKGVYRTAFAIGECYLNFSLVEDELHIREVYYDAGMKIVKVLELCSVKWLGSLGDILPAHIKSGASRDKVFPSR